MAYQYDEHNKQLFFLVYDGIHNSVFESQVVMPLLEQLERSKNLEITLVCFEKKIPDEKTITSKIPSHNRLHVMFCRRWSFLGKYSFYPAVRGLTKMLLAYRCHAITARGPLAGFVAFQALAALARKHPDRLRKDAQDPMPTLTVQARGLCAEEYRYANMRGLSRGFTYVIKKKIYTSLATLEWEVYRNKRKTDYPAHVMIEAVSPALKQYLVDHFRADESKIIIAVNDIPSQVAVDQVATWREQARAELAIPSDAVVYCYSGSFKVWQCAQQTVAAFVYEYEKNAHACMLILTQDKKPFETELAKYTIPHSAYRILTVAPSDLYFYLSAGNYGMLLRESDVINWVSRPTKMLEYKAVGLKIIHNNTIAWLVQRSSM